MMSDMYTEQVEFAKVTDGVRYFYRMTVERDEPMSIVSEYNSYAFNGVRMATKQFSDRSELEEEYSLMTANLRNDGYSKTEWHEVAPIEEFNRDVEEMRRAEESART